MNPDPREHLASAISSRIKDGDVIGVGTGTTVNAVLGVLEKKIKEESLSLTLVPTSYQTKWLCEDAGLPVVGMDYQGPIAWGFDGADEVDSKRRAIKGRGGALYTEKVVAKQCSEYFLIITEDKLSEQLGSISPVPVEVRADECRAVEKKLFALGATDIALRVATFLGRSGPYFTNNGNVILDTTFPEIADELEQEINNIAGVVENGIFTTYATEVLVGTSTSVRSF